MTWFGKDYGSVMQRECPQVDAPVGALCLRCEEAITAGDDGIVDVTGCPFHRACFIRMTVGSLAHQVRLCDCFIPGSVVPHEAPWMTKRQAAEEAVKFYEGEHELKPSQMRSLLIEEAVKHVRTSE